MSTGKQYATHQLDLAVLQSEVTEWSFRNFGDAEKVTSETSALGLAEEVGEVCRALIKRAQGIRGDRSEWDAELRKELGDVVIKLCDVAARDGIQLAGAVAERWAKVRTRNWIADPLGHGIGGER